MRIMKLFAILLALCAATIANAQSLEPRGRHVALAGSSR
jgi:hypothetical protein